jgi:KipI family sensor histidine kinase inhibitor
MMFRSAQLRFIAEDTLLVEFGNSLDDNLHNKVLMLDSALSESAIAAHLETLPTFRSLMIQFDVFALSAESLLETLSNLDISSVKLKAQAWRVPVCFDNGCAQDLAEVSGKLGMTEAEIIERILLSPLKLYMYGFAPGFAYLGGLDTTLNIARRDTPRGPMPQGALMIAGGLASLSSVSMPTGWYVLGQTPVTMFSPQGKALVPFAVGDELRLYALDFDTFIKLQATPGIAGVEKITK